MTEFRTLLSNFVKKSQTNGLLKNDGTVDTTSYISTSNTQGLLKNDGTVDTTNYLSVHQDITGKEDKSNKVTSISSSSTNTQYPSAKAVNTYVTNEMKPKLINANDDLNDYRETGLYYCNLSHDDILTISNCPVSDGFTLFVQENHCYNEGVKQVLTHHQSSATYMRVIYTDYNNNFYSSGWKPVYEDTGWKNVTFKSGFAHYDTSDNYRCRYRRVGKVVELRGSVKNSNQLTANTDYVMATISDITCRPDGWVTYVQQGSSINRLVITIRSDGGIVVNRYGTTSYTAIPKGSWINVHTTFLVD